MAQPSPSSVDVQEIQFKLHDKFTLFQTIELRSNVQLLAAASSQGLLFVGNPNAAELKVLFLKELVDAKSTGRRARERVLPLPNVPDVIACSADCSMLAVSYNLNGAGAFLQIFNVASFITPQIKSLYSVRLSSEENITARQLLWNPVLTNNLAVILSNGALGMYTLKDAQNFEMHSLDKAQQVRCGCWSPKGKQIVLGFPNGKLQQFKPDLTPAKTIACPPNVHSPPFDTIAVHWLSTFQFAAVFLQQGNNMAPSLYIVNAPKGGTPTYINYYDICYSATGPRQHQVSFTHIQAWNLLLVTSANGVELGILGTRETGETPTWMQYTLLDEARIEMPLTESKDETYPIGFAYDTSSSHQLVIGERQMPVMPMVHVLSTHGHLVCFNFLNLTPGAADVCSPPPPTMDSSGEFRVLSEIVSLNESNKTTETQPAAAVQTAADTSFGFAPNAVTSTPAMKEKSTNLFGGAPQSNNLFTQAGAAPFAAPQTKPTAAPFGSLQFGGTPTVAPPTTASTTFSGFGGLPAGSTPTFGGFPGTGVVKPADNTLTVTPQAQPKTAAVPDEKAIELEKPLYTVPATFAPPAPVAVTAPTQMQSAGKQLAIKEAIESGEIDEIVKQMIFVQICAFDEELKQLRNHSNNLLTNINNPDELKLFTKRLNDLQEINEQAKDRDFELDVQNLRHSLNETYAMLAECRTKLELYNNPDITRLTSISTYDPISRRQLAKLQSYLAINQAQLQQLQQQIDAQWSNYQDLVHRSAKSKMHIPCLDGIYQRMTKLKDLLSRQRTKLNYVRVKLKQRGFSYKSTDGVDGIARPSATAGDVTIDSLADSILTLSLSHIVEAERAKLPPEKLNAIRDFTRQQNEITIIRPRRPDRVDLKSEVILETKLQSERKVRERAAKAEAELIDKQRQKALSNTAFIESVTKVAPTTQLAKPTATKPTVSATAAQVSFAPPTQLQSAAPPSFNLGGTSPFVKTSAAAAAPISVKSEETAISKPFAMTANNAFNAPVFTGFGMGNTPQTTLSFGVVPKPAQPAAVITKTDSALKEALNSPAAPMQMPISFSAKVIGGDAAPKPFPTVGTSNVPTSVFATLSANNTSVALKPGNAVVATQQQQQQQQTTVTNKENKKPEDAAPTTKNQINAAATENPTAVSTGNIFSGFSGNTKSSIFDGKSSAGTFSFANLGGSLYLGTTTATSTPLPQFGATAKPLTTMPFFVSQATSAPTNATPVVVATSSVSSTQTADTTAAHRTGVPGALTTNTGLKADSLNVAVSSAEKTVMPSYVPTTDNTVDYTKAPSAGNTATASLPNASTVTVTPAVAAAAETTATTLASTAEPTDSLFGTLNICKPTVKDASAKPASTNIFSGFSPAGNSAFTLAPVNTSGNENEPADMAKSIFTSALGPNINSFGFGKQIAAALPTVAVATTSESVAAIAPTTIPPTASTVTSGTTATPTTLPLFGATVVDAFKTTSAAATNTTSTIFGGAVAPSPFIVATSDAAPLFRGAIAPVATSVVSPFVAASTTITTPVAAPTGIFAAAAAATAPSPPPPASGGNIFSGIAKPEQSVFSSPTAQPPASGLFAAAAAATPSPFISPTSTPTVASGGSLFGGTGATGFVANPAASGGSIFGGAGNSGSTSPFGNSGSIFGGAKPPDSGNIFASAVAATPAPVGNSIFGQNVFGQPAAVQQSSGGSLFAAASPTGTPQQPAPSAFGGSGSIFGGAAPNTASSGGSLFGGAGGGGGTAAVGFGAFSQPNASPFSSPTSPTAGSFAQGGMSVAQTGFGSPQQASAFAKPVFGGAPAFGSPPAFGAQPSFGGGATFGSPKGFGSFNTPNAPSQPAPVAFGASPNQKSNLFEALGASDTGLSFGNLAQAQANAPKPSFGGSSFMNYRA